MKKIINALKFIFGWGILISLLVGGLTFLGYVFALIVGGDLAEKICFFIYNTITPILIYISTISVLIGLFKMYLNGEIALSTKK